MGKHSQAQSPLPLPPLGHSPSLLPLSSFPLTLGPAQQHAPTSAQPTPLAHLPCEPTSTLLPLSPTNAVVPPVSSFFPNASTGHCARVTIAVNLLCGTTFLRRRHPLEHTRRTTFHGHFMAVKVLRGYYQGCNPRVSQGTD